MSSVRLEFNSIPFYLHSAKSKEQLPQGILLCNEQSMDLCPGEQAEDLQQEEAKG